MLSYTCYLHHVTTENVLEFLSLRNRQILHNSMKRSKADDVFCAVCNKTVGRSWLQRHLDTPFHHSQQLLAEEDPDFPPELLQSPVQPAFKRIRTDPANAVINDSHWTREPMDIDSSAQSAGIGPEFMQGGDVGDSDARSETSSADSVSSAEFAWANSQPASPPDDFLPSESEPDESVTEEDDSKAREEDFSWESECFRLLCAQQRFDAEAIQAIIRTFRQPGFQLSRLPRSYSHYQSMLKQRCGPKLPANEHYITVRRKLRKGPSKRTIESKVVRFSECINCHLSALCLSAGVVCYAVHMDSSTVCSSSCCAHHFICRSLQISTPYESKR